MNSQNSFVYQIHEKLPTKTRNCLELSNKSNEPQKSEELRLFLKKGAQASEATSRHETSTLTKPQQSGELRNPASLY